MWSGYVGFKQVSIVLGWVAYWSSFSHGILEWEGHIGTRLVPYFTVAVGRCAGRLNSFQVHLTFWGSFVTC